MNLRPMTSFCRKMHVVFLIHRSSFLTILVIVHLNFKDKMPVHLFTTETNNLPKESDSTHMFIFHFIYRYIYINKYIFS